MILKNYKIALSFENLPSKQEEVFNWYLEDFGLKVENLKNKTILDVGSGMVPNFVEYCLEKGITDKAYAVDHWPFGHEIESFSTDEDLEYVERFPLEGVKHLKSKKHFIQAEGEQLPIRKGFKFDFILMRAALGQESNITALIKELVSYLRHGGELRLAPVWEEQDGIRLRKAVDELGKNDFVVEWRENIVKRDTKEKPHLVIIRKS